MTRVSREFFLQDAVSVARLLPGKEIVLKRDGSEARYMITETEAYLGDDDRACHASRGRTPRTEAMYLEGGHLYVYFVYGMHWMLNIVTGNPDDPQAVLIRGISGFTGPGRLTKALGIERSFYGEDIISSGRLWIEDNGFSPQVSAGPRIGIDYAGEPWVSKPWRYIINDRI